MPCLLATESSVEICHSDTRSNQSHSIWLKREAGEGERGEGKWDDYWEWTFSDPVESIRNVVGGGGEVGGGEGEGGNMSLWDTRWNQRHSMPRIRLLQPSKHNQAKSEIRLHFGSVFGMWRIYHGVIPTIWFLFATLNRFSGAIQPENGNYLTTGRGGRKNFKAFGAIASFAYRFPPVFKWEGRREGGGHSPKCWSIPHLWRQSKKCKKKKKRKIIRKSNENCWWWIIWFIKFLQGNIGDCVEFDATMREGRQWQKNRRGRAFLATSHFLGFFLYQFFV